VYSFSSTKRLLKKDKKQSLLIFIFFGKKIAKSLRDFCVMCERPIIMFSAGLEREELCKCVVLLFGVGYLTGKKSAVNFLLCLFSREKIWKHDRLLRL